MLETLETPGLIAVIGASGSGKSPVVNAGLVPALRKSSQGAWDFRTFTPDEKPIQLLLAALDPPYEDLFLTGRLTKLENDAKMLVDAKFSLSD